MNNRLKINCDAFYSFHSKTFGCIRYSPASESDKRTKLKRMNKRKEKTDANEVIRKTRAKQQLKKGIEITHKHMNRHLNGFYRR